MVPSDYTFFQLHVAIQSAMGWTDSHLHAFYINTPKEKPIRIEFITSETMLYGDEDPLDETEVEISQFLNKKVKQLQYCYDFGDNWAHAVLFEKELEAQAGQEYPQCITGANACPPEDCGGVGGYVRLLETVKDPANPEQVDTLEWLGITHPEELESTYFNPKDVDFEDPSERLKEYKAQFEPGSTSQPAGSSQNQLTQKDQVVDTGMIWEIGLSKKPLAQPLPSGEYPYFVTIVHRDSFFILGGGFIEKGNLAGVQGLLEEALNKGPMIRPEKIITSSQEILDILTKFAEKEGFKIEKGKLKAAPQIIKEMKQFFR